MSGLFKLSLLVTLPELHAAEEMAKANVTMCENVRMKDPQKE